MQAFRQVVSKLQDGNQQEALIGLEFVLRIDPAFRPALNLQKQLESSSDIDLSQVLEQLQDDGTATNVDELLVEAVDFFNDRDFLAAHERVKKVLLDLPGHTEARQLNQQIEKSLKTEAQIGQYLAHAREALDSGDPQEATNFVLMAQALDPHHQGITSTLQEIEGKAGGAAVPAQPTQPPPGAGEDQSFATMALESIPLPIEEEVEAAPPATFKEPAAPAGEADEQDDLFTAFAADTPAETVPETVQEAAVPAEAPQPTGGDDFGFEPDGGGFSFDGGETEVEAASADSDLSGGSGGDFAFEPEDDGGETFAFDGDAGSGADEGETPLFEETPGEISDLFEADVPPGGGDDFDPGAGPSTASPEDAARIDELLVQGSSAFDRSEFQEAIDVWSRIFLIDPSHHETTRRIEEARQRKDEIDRKVEHLLYEAQDTAASGDNTKAQNLLDEILSLQPNHIEAIELKERLAPAAAGDEEAPAPEPALPDLEPDLFEDDLPPVKGGIAAAADDGGVEPAPAATSRRLPWLPIGLAVGGLVIILLGVWFGTQFLASDSQDEQAEALNRALDQAEALFKQGQVEEAIHLLQEYPATTLDQSRIARKITRYQKALTPPTPTPIPESLTTAEDLLDQDKLWPAYQEVARGLKAHPQDPALLEVEGRILQREPLLASLLTAGNEADYRAAVSICQDLVVKHPSRAEFAREFERNLFNASVVELRAYNLTGAEGHLSRLASLQPGDAETARILQFIHKYKTRPVDMQLRIFIGSLSLR